MFQKFALYLIQYFNQKPVVNNLTFNIFQKQIPY